MIWSDIFFALVAFYTFRFVLRFVVSFVCELLGFDHKSVIKTFF